MAYIVFGKVDNAINTNLKELYLIYYIFKNEKVNTASFIFSCMEKVINVKKGEIMVGRLITSITKSLRLEREIRRIEHIIWNNVLDMLHVLRISWLWK